MRQPGRAYLSLVVASLLFGATFVVVKEAIATLPPLAFVGWRFLLGAVVILLLAVPRGWPMWRDGALAGTLLFAGYAFQTEGLARTTASNSGLITGLYVVLTPLLAALVTRRSVGHFVTRGVVLAFAGLALLTVGDQGLAPQWGDGLTLACALAFAAHIVFLSRKALHHPVVPFTGVQLATVAALSLGASALLEGLPLPARAVWGALLVTGVAVSAGAFLLQVWSQTVVGPSRTAIVLALEPAFAAVFAAWLLEERLTTTGWVGAGLILAGIYLVLVLADQSRDLPLAEAVSPAH
ncbi:MAG: DMT family transporter [Actinomycetota bacterium]|nr:DMT family transporter [Actinomycetota bacterium]